MMLRSLERWLGSACVVGVLTSCGSSASSLCADVCECSGCSEEEEQDCVDDIEDRLGEAEDEGCSDQADELLSCYGNELECRDGEVDLDGCQSEAEELARCVGPSSSGTGGGSGAGVGGSGGGTGSPSPGGNVCDEAAEICGTGGEGGGGGGECVAAASCSAQCIVDADSCDFTDESLGACVSSCSAE